MRCIGHIRSPRRVRWGIRVLSHTAEPHVEWGAMVLLSEHAGLPDTSVHGLRYLLVFSLTRTSRAAHLPVWQLSYGVATVMEAWRE